MHIGQLLPLCILMLTSCLLANTHWYLGCWKGCCWKGCSIHIHPHPDISETWDVAKVLSYLEGQTINDSCSLKVLSLHTVMLLAWTHPCRSADPSKLDLRGYHKTLKEAQSALSKQGCPAWKFIEGILFPSFQNDVQSCPWTCTLRRQPPYGAMAFNCLFPLNHTTRLLTLNCLVVKRDYSGFRYRYEDFQGSLGLRCLNFCCC